MSERPSTLVVVHNCAGCGEPVECTPDCIAVRHWHEDCLEQARAAGAWMPPWHVRLRAWFFITFFINAIVFFRAFKMATEHGRESPGCGFSPPQNGEPKRVRVTWSWKDETSGDWKKNLVVHVYCNVCLRPVTE